MPFNYPPNVSLVAYFHLTGGHDVNPSAQTLLGTDQQLFSSYDNLATNIMASAGLPAQLKPVVILLVAMIPPGAGTVTQVQLACLFLRNALIVRNHPTAALADLTDPLAASRAFASAALATGLAPSSAAASAVGRNTPSGRKRPRKRQRRSSK